MARRPTLRTLTVNRSVFSRNAEEERLRDRLVTWQRLLGLADWRVDLSIVSRDEMEEDTWAGQCERHPSRMYARIKIQDLDQMNPDLWPLPDGYDQTALHELVHLRLFRAHLPSTHKHHEDYEAAVDKIADAILTLEREVAAAKRTYEELAKRIGPKQMAEFRLEDLQQFAGGNPFQLNELQKAEDTLGRYFSEHDVEEIAEAVKVALKHHPFTKENFARRPMEAIQDEPADPKPQSGPYNPEEWDVPPPTPFTGFLPRDRDVWCATNLMRGTFHTLAEAFDYWDRTCAPIAAAEAKPDVGIAAAEQLAAERRRKHWSEHGPWNHTEDELKEQVRLKTEIERLQKENEHAKIATSDPVPDSPSSLMDGPDGAIELPKPTRPASNPGDGTPPLFYGSSGR